MVDVQEVVAHTLLTTAAVGDISNAARAKLKPFSVTEMEPDTTLFGGYSAVIEGASNVNVVRPVPVTLVTVKATCPDAAEALGAMHKTAEFVVQDAEAQRLDAMKPVAVKSLGPKFRPASVSDQPAVGMPFETSCVTAGASNE